MSCKRVLLVEDEERWIRVSVAALQGLDLQLLVKDTYGEGMQALRQGPYDVLIFDGTLGTIATAGVEFIQAAKRILRPVPPIILHSQAPRSDRNVEHAVQLGAAYAWKVDGAERLRQKLEELL